MSTPFTSEDQRYEYDLTPQSVVIDAGGYRGDFAAEIHRRYGCQIWVFEPVPDFREHIVTRMTGIQNIHVEPFALGGMPGEVPFYLQDNSTGIFALPTETPLMVEMITPKTALELTGAPEIDLIKLNVEGSEFVVIESMMKDGIIARFKNIQVQWHAVVGFAESRFAHLQSELTKTHHLTFDGGWMWQNWKLNP